MKWRSSLLIGVLFVLAGLLLGSQQLLDYWQQRNSQPIVAASQLASQPPPAPGANVISGMPVHLDIPALRISLDVEPGYYNKASRTWSLSLTKAEYAAVTVEPNNKSGNTFIYGHNRLSVFENLLKIQPQDQVSIETDNHHTFVYQLVGEHDTQPNDVSLFNYQGPPILTLQTCSGLWYQNRRLFVFSLVKVA